MAVRIKNGKLLIELPLEKPRRSATGKTLLIASTHGVQNSNTEYKGKTVSCVANAFIFPDERLGSGSAQTSRRQEETDEEEDEDD